MIPFLENVTRGRGVPRERLEQVAEHYYRFGGVSPINQQCRDLLAAIEKDFAASGVDLPVYWGNRNWDPYLADTVAGDGRRRRAARDRVRDLRLQLVLQLPAVPARTSSGPGRRPAPAPRGSTSCGRTSTTPASSSRWPTRRARAVASLPTAPREHGSAGLHRAQHPGGHGGGQRAAGGGVPGAARRGGPAGRRSGSARSPRVRGGWPTRAAAARRRSPGWARTSATASPSWPRPGARASVLVPVGFVSDHMEVMYDLDVEAAPAGPAARPAAGPGGDARHRPAVRRDDHRAGGRAAGRSAAPGARRSRPGRRTSAAGAAAGRAAPGPAAAGSARERPRPEPATLLELACSRPRRPRGCCRLPGRRGRPRWWRPSRARPTW